MNILVPIRDQLLFTGGQTDDAVETHQNDGNYKEKFELQVTFHVLALRAKGLISARIRVFSTLVS